MWRAVRIGDRAMNILSAKAREWKTEAGAILALQRPKPVHGAVELHVTLSPPTKRRFDLDNRVKAIIDLLVLSGVIEGDDTTVVKKLTIELGDHAVGARVTVTRWTE
jgi:crossover junction endodeoxyribonuclease RusA